MEGDDVVLRCQTCGKDATKRCSQCHQVVYCGRECQKLDGGSTRRDVALLFLHLLRASGEDYVVQRMRFGNMTWVAIIIGSVTPLVSKKL
jgi:hypothetical protein